MSIERIATLFERCGGPEKNFPPTDLYKVKGSDLRLAFVRLVSHARGG